MDVQTAFWLKYSARLLGIKYPTEFCNVILMSSRSLNDILIRIPTELFNFIFAAYNLRFILPRLVCLHLYAKGRCM